MKVEGPSKPNRPSKAERAKAAAKKGQATASGSSADDGADLVEISDHQDTLDLIKSLVKKSPDVRTDLVDRIVGEIKGGKYKINLEKVAEGFIRDAIENEMASRKTKK